jgi:hypothetical protein
MDRKLAYPTQIPLVEDWLNSQKNTMIALAALTQCINGTPVVADGLAVIPTVPASLAVQVLPGSIYSPVAVDTTDYGIVGNDTVHTIMKQGVNLDAVVLTLDPPTTAGQSINYLIQAQLSEGDTDDMVLPYVNAADPDHPFSGPNDSGIMQPTTREARVVVQAKAGVAATAGTQTTPAPDDGWVGLYQVTVAQGATTLDSTKIIQVESAPFLFKKLPEIPAWVQSGAFLWANNDTGTANAIVATCTPKVTSYTKGQHFFVKKGPNANTANLTFDGGGGAVAVLDLTGAQIGPGNAGAGYVMHLVFDGASMRWVNGSITQTSVTSITAASGEGITVKGDNSVNLNIPGLGAGLPTALDLLVFFDNEGGHHMKVSWASLLALIQASVGSQNLKALAPVIMMREQRPGTAGAPSGIGGAWNTRKLNTTLANQMASIGSVINTSTGQITLPAGSYRVDAAGASYASGNSRVRLQDVTNGVTLGQGITTDTHTDGPGGASDTHAVTTPSTMNTYFTLAAPAVVELQQYVSNTTPLGDTTNIGSDQIHIDSYISITKDG